METPSLESVLGSMSKHGAPLFGGDRETDLGLDETLAYGVLVSRQVGSAARMWPVVFSKNKEKVNVDRVFSLATSLGEGKACAFLLWVSGKLMGDLALVALAETRRPDPPKQEYYFSEFPELAKRKTEEFARKWSFFMAGSFDQLFGSCYRKFTRDGNG